MDTKASNTSAVEDGTGQMTDGSLTAASHAGLIRSSIKSATEKINLSVRERTTRAHRRVLLLCAALVQGLALAPSRVRLPQHSRV